MALERCTPVDNTGSLGHPALRITRTPLNVSAWREALCDHPDQSLARYIVKRISEGFRIGFDRSHPLVSTNRNLPSATEQAEVLTNYVEKEVALGRIIGPLPPSPVWHINRVGVIPKGHTPGKWRLITDLSHPPAASVNDGIDRELCSLSSNTVEQVAATVSRLGRGALLHGEGRYRFCLQARTSPPRRQTATGRTVEERRIRGRDAPVWTALGP